MARDRKEFLNGSQLITVTRRILPHGTGLRVRVTATDLRTGQKNWTDFRDFDHLATGDAEFFKMIDRIQAKLNKI